jgi:hypothetical protein
MNKFHDKKTVIDRITFDSQKEGMRYCELKLLQKAGVISELERQKKFELQPAFYYQGRKQRPIYYVCDFYYREGDKYIIEDVKSPITRNNQVYKLKKKIMMYKGYEVRET